ncbi:MAG TPA: hypothetical protein PLY70_11855 [Saprospiraceae bacterium]|nr:hypothetical protein [Saprospiraceae bacterium]HPN69265.1 hypothetical protein [Saprospiraceae bacterium]
MDYGTLQVKANAYKTVLSNTVNYRTEWNRMIKPMIHTTLNEILKACELKGEVKNQDNIENLEAVILDLGKSSSGISENLEGSDVKRTMVKSNGAIIYQQLFNGKIMVMLMSPYIEGYGEPKPPKTLEILRPDELNKPFILRHFELFLKDITEWEDFDDDQPTTKSNIGFNPIGFHTEELNQADSILEK